jgi:hypothetical protein
MDNGLIIQQGQAIGRSRQAGVSKPEVGQQYRMAGRLRGWQSGQADGLRVRTGKGKNQEGEIKRDWGKQEQTQKRCLTSQTR